MSAPENRPDKATKEKWRNDPANWRYTLLYYNPEDRRWFPPKRYGGGWTVNWANRNSIIAFIIAVTVIVGGTILYMNFFAARS